MRLQPDILKGSGAFKDTHCKRRSIIDMKAKLTEQMPQYGGKFIEHVV